MNNKLLSNEQIEQFIEKGWVKIEEAIPHGASLKAQEEIWEILFERYQIDKLNKKSWSKSFIQLSENYKHGAFQACNSEKLILGIEELLGEGRIEYLYGENFSFGWWPINFSLGNQSNWNIPIGGWHWDGMHFRHFLNSPEQGILLLIFFSDVSERGGGTLVAEGSHKIVARFLSQFPEGIEYKDAIPLLNRSHPWLAELTNSFGDVTDSDVKLIYTTDQINMDKFNAEDRIEKFMNRTYIDNESTKLRIVEMTGKAGDVVLCHPFLYHSGSPNHSNTPRIMCNLNVPLKEKMRFDRSSEDDYSVVEKSIIQALNGESKVQGGKDNEVLVSLKGGTNN